MTMITNREMRLNCASENFIAIPLFSFPNKLDSIGGNNGVAKHV